MKLFQPTHYLVSPTRRIPVLLVSKGDISWAYSEEEWREQKVPAFKIHVKLGFFCYDMKVINYTLEPIASAPLQENAGSNANDSPQKDALSSKR